MVPETKRRGAENHENQPTARAFLQIETMRNGLKRKKKNYLDDCPEQHVVMHSHKQIELGRSH